MKNPSISLDKAIRLLSKVIYRPGQQNQEKQENKERQVSDANDNRTGPAR